MGTNKMGNNVLKSCLKWFQKTKQKTKHKTCYGHFFLVYARWEVYDETIICLIKILLIRWFWNVSQVRFLEKS